jgi:F-type H+-transporting ATPase subunit b
MADTVLIAQVSSSSSPADAVQSGAVVAASQPTSAEVHAGTTTPSEAHTTFPPFDPVNFASQIFWFVLAFVVLYILMSRVALPQIGGIIDKRRGRIDGDLQEAERLKGDTDKAIAAYEEALATARRNAQSIAEETRNSIKADLDTKRKAVETELSGKMTEAEGRIQATKTQALGRVGEIASETAAAVVRQLTGEADAKDVADAVAQVVKG